MKRLLDVCISAAALLVLWPLLFLIALLVRMTSSGPVFFRQERVGLDFKRFRIFKFRSMVQEAPSRGAQITVGEDPRITTVGRILRKTKIDELPQLINVLVGDMSFVGPRPEVPKYVEMFREDYAEVLTVRPGITDLASLKYSDESTILGQAADPEKEYVTRVLPEKLSMAKEYVRRRSLTLDLVIIIKTILLGLGLKK